MKASEAGVHWVPRFSFNNGDADAGSICVGRDDRRRRFANELWMPATALGSYGTHPVKDDPIKERLAVFVLFDTVTVRDGIDVKKAHEAFLAIDEYRETISPDIDGAAA